MTRIVSMYGPSECGTCGRIFQCNARTVPTVQALGIVMAVCRDCIEVANARRAERRLPLLKIPPGAYEPEPS
jgi:hypothetical protein